MPEFVTVTEVARTPADVFDYIVDLSRWPAFRGWGPIPGIVKASLPDDELMGLGARVRVENTDGSTHHEVVTSFSPGRHYAVRMEVSPPASFLIDQIEEDVTLESCSVGARMTRRFRLKPRSILVAPVAFLIAHILLRHAVVVHDRVVQRALSAPSG